MFGTGDPKPMSVKSMGLFAARDSMTILASFSLPGIISAHMQRDMAVGKTTADTVAQLVTPVSMQIFNTPMHLLGLDIYNRPDANGVERRQFIQREYVKTVLARMARIFPAFGIGGVVNKYVRKTGNAALHEKYSSDVWAEEFFCRSVLW